MSPVSLLRRLADWQQFAAVRDACLEADSADPAVQVLHALALAHLGEPDAARARLAAVRLHGAQLDLATRVDLAAVHLALGELPQGIALLEAGLQEDAGHPLLLARLAWCRLQQERTAEALALYRRSADAEPRVPVLMNLARLHLQQAGPDIAAAQQVLDRAAHEAQLQAAEEPASLHAFQLQQQRGLQLEIWSAAGAFAEAESWLAVQREVLDPQDWMSLLCGHAALLAGQDRHAQAEELLRSALQHVPENPTVLAPLAELARVQGRAQQADTLLRRAIAACPHDSVDALMLYVRLSTNLLLQAPAAARDAAEKALAIAQAAGPALSVASAQEWRARAEAAVAAAEAQEGRYPQAEARYRAVLASLPDFVAALAGLGQLHMQQGRIEEAVALFERLAQLDPAQGQAALIGVRRIPQDDATLQRLEQFARTPGIEGKVRSGLLFQLATAWEKRGDAARAFALARDANEAAHKLLRYDPRAHRQACARVRHAFSASLYAHRPEGGLDTTLPVFVVGMPRSGTTLVEQIIAGHSQVHGAGELGIVPQVIAGLERWERRTGSGRHYPDCVDDLSPEVRKGVAEGVLAQLREHAPQARHVVDKLPHNFENIGLIKFLFPRARIISVRRDPRDIAVSNYFTDFAARHGGMGFAYDLGWIGEQLADHNLLMQHWHRLFPGDILEVRYEDVVADTEGQARRMLDYIGVDWEPQVLAFSELQRPVKTASVWQVRQPIYTTSRARWERHGEHLAPLIAATNAPIRWDPIEDMAALPEPGLLDACVRAYRQGHLDDAEQFAKRLLQHLPEHAAANFLLGSVYMRKGYLADGLPLMEAAQARCPWNAEWRADLARARELAGETA